MELRRLAATLPIYRPESLSLRATIHSKWSQDALRVGPTPPYSTQNVDRLTGTGVWTSQCNCEPIGPPALSAVMSVELE